LKTKELKAERRTMTCATCGKQFFAIETECSSNQWRSGSGKDCSKCDALEDEELDEANRLVAMYEPAQPYIMPSLIEKKVKLKSKAEVKAEEKEIAEDVEKIKAALAALPPKKLTNKERKAIGATIKVPVRVYAANNNFEFKKEDCSEWLKRESNSDIERLANDDWAGSGNCDNYQYWLRDKKKDKDAIALDEYLDTRSCGWIVEFDAKAVIEWMRYNKPNKLAYVKAAYARLTVRREARAKEKAKRAEYNAKAKASREAREAKRAEAKRLKEEARVAKLLAERKAALDIMRTAIRGHIVVKRVGMVLLDL
jgi:hypothetical protein